MRHRFLVSIFHFEGAMKSGPLKYRPGGALDLSSGACMNYVSDISWELLLSIYLGRQCRNWKWLPLVTAIMGYHPNRQMIVRLAHLHDPPNLSPRECSKNIPVTTVTTVTVSKSNLASLSFVYKTLPVVFHTHHHYSFNILQFHICSLWLQIVTTFFIPSSAIPATDIHNPCHSTAPNSQQLQQ